MATKKPAAKKPAVSKKVKELAKSVVPAAKKAKSKAEIEAASSVKRENYLRLSKPRIEKVIKAMESFGKLSSPSYEWKQDEVEKALKAISISYFVTRAKFEKTRRWVKNP
jgi:uncharacterized tellurite resistance protein B-like protein